MSVSKYIVLVSALSGCVSPMRYASLDDHRDMMDECRAMCGEGRVLKYRPRSGECECVDGTEVGK